MADDDKTKDDGALKAMEAQVATLKAELDAEKGKSAGILADKKKAQQATDDLKTRLDELESKDLGEVERMKLDMERLQSKYDKAEADKAELQATYEGAQRSNSLNAIGSKVKFLDSVPEDARKTLIDSAFKDIDLGNEVLVADRLKTFTDSYSGMLKADVPTGTGDKPGNATTPTNVSMDQAVNKPLAEVAKDPHAYINECLEASQE